MGERHSAGQASWAGTDDDEFFFMSYVDFFVSIKGVEADCSIGNR